MEKWHSQNILKPQKKSFYFFSLFGTFVVLAIFSVVVIMAFFWAKMAPQNYLYVLVADVVLFGLCAWWMSVMYRKTEYELGVSKLTIRSGTPFSDASTDIDFDKITELTARLGFWEQVFFKTGSLHVSTGGMGKVVLTNLDSPLENYEKIQDYMRDNGFHLQKDSLVQEARPHVLAVVFELMSYIFAILLFAFYTLGQMGSLENLRKLDLAEFLTKNIFWVGLIVLVVIVLATLRYLDLRKRVYMVFTDAITYEEGFFTKNYSVLPMEKVADTDNRQGLISKIFGLHDIIISSEGSGNQVIFSNMIDGEKMLANIKYLKNSISLGEKKSEITTDDANQNSENASIGYKNIVDREIRYNEHFTANFKMNLKRTFLGAMVAIIFVTIISLVVLFFAGRQGLVMLFAILPIIFWNLIALVAALYTHYKVDVSTIESRFSFLSNRHLTFTVDKITRIDILRNPLDWICGTATVVFASIGSSQRIMFKNISYDENLEKNLLEKIWIYPDENTEKTIGIKFSFVEFIKANLSVVVLISIAVISMFVFASVMVLASQSLKILALLALIPFIFLWIIFAWGKLAYSPRFYHNAYTEEYIKSFSGVIFRIRAFALFDDIKGLSATKNIATNVGKILFKVAVNPPAFQQQQQNSNQEQQQWSIFSPYIAVNYVENAFEMLDIADEKISRYETIDSSVLHDSRRSLKNSIIIGILPIIIIAILNFFILSRAPEGIYITTMIAVLVLIMLILWLVSVYCERYRLESQRVIKFSGIFYKTRETILYEKMNFINKNQWILGKICGNGNIEIFTLGADVLDMNLPEIDDYINVYDILREQNAIHRKK